MGTLNDAEQNEALKGRVTDALRTVYDPELSENIYDLGLVYGVEVDAREGKVHIRMTLTTPGCPLADAFPSMVEGAVRQAEGVKDVTVELVWDPPWSPDRMSEAARLRLGLPP